MTVQGPVKKQQPDGMPHRGDKLLSRMWEAVMGEGNPLPSSTCPEGDTFIDVVRCVSTRDNQVSISPQTLLTCSCRHGHTHAVETSSPTL